MRDSLARITRAVTSPRAARRDAATRLEAALPDLSVRERRRLLSRSFSHRAHAAAEQRELHRIDPARICSRLDFEGWERIEETERAGAGVVFLTASLGVSRLVPIVLDLYKDGDSVERLLPPLDHPAPERTAENSSRHSIALPFLGRSFQVSTLAAEKALTRGVAALPIFAFLEPRRRFRVVVRPPIAPPGGVVEKEVLTRRFLAAIEAEILAHPEQYDWLRPKAGAG